MSFANNYDIRISTGVQIGYSMLEMNNVHGYMKHNKLSIEISPVIQTNMLIGGIGLATFIAAYDNSKTISEQKPFNFATCGFVVNAHAGLKVADHVYMYVQPELLLQTKYGDSDFEGKVDHIVFNWQVGFDIYDKHRVYVGRSDSRMIGDKSNVHGTVFVGYKYSIIFGIK